jgi:hypothetical protein
VALLLSPPALANLELIFSHHSLETLQLHTLQEGIEIGFQGGDFGF